jgi:hypothetical protein
MKGYISSILLIFVLIFCSCATVLNSKTTRIDITTTGAAKIIVNHDTIPTVNNRIEVRVPRQADSLKKKLLATGFQKQPLLMDLMPETKTWVLLKASGRWIKI